MYSTDLSHVWASTWAFFFRLSDCVSALKKMRGPIQEPQAEQHDGYTGLGGSLMPYRLPIGEYMHSPGAWRVMSHEGAGSP